MIEIVERKIDDAKNYYIKKRSRKKKRDFLTGAKPKKGNPLYNFEESMRKFQAKYKVKHVDYKSPIIPCTNISREEFVDRYLHALHKRMDIFSNVYCCKSYLLAHEELVPAFDKETGYASFIKDTNKYFYLPAYKWMNEDKVFWKPKESYVTFPLAISPYSGVRLDVQYMFLRDVSVYMIPKALKIRNTMNNVPYTTYSIPYSDHSKDDKLTTFMSNYRRIVKVRPMTEDLDGFEKMLFNDYGQNRYVVERTDTNRIMAVLIWEDTGDVVHMLYTVGYIEPKEWYGYTDWKKFRAEKCFRYPETILRYEFMKRFPKGTMFNGGGCGFSPAMKWMNQISQPCHIYELRTYRNVVCKKVGGVYVKPCGELPFEYYMSTHSPTWWVDCKNRVLFDRSYKKKLTEMTDPKQIEKEIKYRKRQAARFLSLKRLGEKYLKNSQNSS